MAGNRDSAERRNFPRLPVHLRATIFAVFLGCEIPCTVTELSLSGCRVSTDRDFRGAIDSRVEVCFTARGTSFRLCGLTQWTEGTRDVGVRFLGMTARREIDLADVLAEVGVDLEAEAAKEAVQWAESRKILEEAAAAIPALRADLAQKRAAQECARKAAESAAWEAQEAARKLRETQTLHDDADRLCAELAAKEAARQQALAASLEFDRAAPPSVPQPSIPVPTAAAAPSAAAAPPSRPNAELPAWAAAHPAAAPTDAAAASPHSAAAPAQVAAAPAHPAAAAPRAAAPSARERRHETRHAVDAQAGVFLLDVRSKIMGRILDVSLSGCRIRFAEKFPVGIYRRVETEFILDGLPFRLPGVVQSLHDKFHAGIRFLDVSERKREQLLQVIQEITDMQQEAQQHPPNQQSACA